MGRRRIQTMGLIFSGLCFALAAWLFLALGEENGLSARSASAKKLLSITEKLTELSDEESLSFSLCLGDVPLPCDRGRHIVYLPVDMDDALWENGRLEATEGVAAIFEKGFEQADKLALLAAGEGIPFLAVAGKGYERWTLLPVGLPVMDLEPAEGLSEGDKPLYQLSVYEPAAEGVKVTKCLTRADLRGNTSLTYEKKSLRLRLRKEKDGAIKKEKKKLLGMRKDDDWILNSLYADPSRLRDKLSMDLWQETGAKSNPFGIAFGVTGEYVEVIINEGYTGLYLLSYPVDRKLLQMEKVSTQLSRGEDLVERIYKKKYTAPLAAESFMGALPDPGMPDFRGGYYLKGDAVLQSEEEWESLRRLAEELQKASEGQANELLSLCDQENVLENWLFYQAIGGFDNENKNHYFVTRRQNGALKGYFIPWDMNISFGCVYAENPFYCEESMEPVEQVVAFEPGQIMYEQDLGESKKALAAIWKRWREGPFATERVTERIDALEKRLQSSGALARECERWPAGNASPELGHMKRFTEERLAFVDRLMAEDE
ncbi:MAG: CotH kinase family protein [Lachnospiraceae bacterium]|nr:CotH kinase family protein [Lachnospiraceae bacterium]